MASIYHLKTWLSLTESASFLSEETKLNISKKDILSLVFEDKLDLYVHFFKQSAVDIGYERSYDEEMYSYFFDKKTFKANYYGLDGYYKISNSKNINFKEHIINLINDKRFDNEYLIGIIVENDAGNYYEIVADNDPDIGFRYDCEKIALKHVYPITIPYNKLDFFLKKSQAFEMIERLQTTKAQKPVKFEANKTDIKIIGAMLDVIVKKIEKRQNAPFHSESELIQAILDDYNHIYGISKRTLESRFSEAKKALSEE